MIPLPPKMKNALQVCCLAARLEAYYIVLIEKLYLFYQS